MSEPLAEDTFRERIRARLLAAAREVLSNEGLAALQARRLARDAACSVGTLYNIFGDIDGLILAVNQVTLRALGEALEAAARNASSRNLGERLMALARAYLAYACAHPKSWRAVFAHRLPDGVLLPHFYAADRSRLLALIEAELVAAITEPLHRRVAAHALFSAVHGIVQLSLDEKLVDFDAGQCERQMRFIVEHVAAGLTEDASRATPSDAIWAGD